LNRNPILHRLNPPKPVAVRGGACRGRARVE
jgi:hypothetical protein